MFYHYHQNNSGGSYCGPKVVCVEADNDAEANRIAVESGEIYFNGVRKGADCPCCGDRWHPVDEDDASEGPEQEVSSKNFLIIRKA